MSFNIWLGNTNKPRKALDKSPSFPDRYKFSGTLKDDCDILNPTFMIRTSVAEDVYIPQVAQCNYMYIENFGRYYFLTDFHIIRNQILEVSGHVDVWYTYRTEIRNNTGLILRASKASLYNKLLIDDKVKIYNNPFIVQKNFSGDVFPDKNTFILVVTGGGKKA